MTGRTWRIVFALAILLAYAGPAQARVTRMVVEQRESPAYDGRFYGEAGPYEVIRGHVFGELDPKDPLNAIITDIGLAPRNARGMVEYAATFALAKPVDMAKASGVMLYQVPNRGMGLNFAPTDRGDIVLMSGWQGDIPPKPALQTIAVPVARNPDGSSVTGPALAVFVNMAPHVTTLPILGGIGIGTPRPAPASLDIARASLVKRSPDGAASPVTDWAFADCAAAPFPGTPDSGKLCLKDGFDPAFRYELSYVAKDPPVLGIGFAATRDINAFFRRATKDDAGTANPVAGAVRWAIGVGYSQSGNFIRSFIALGFNQDEARRIVWDGAEPNIAARLLALNLRFAAPGGAADVYEPGSEGALWWSDYEDRARKRPAAGLLDRCRASDTCPKIFELFGAAEFWGLRMSPDLVGTDAGHDIPLPANVRRYYSPGVTHGGGQGGFSADAPGAAVSTTGRCLLPANPNPSADTGKALRAALIDWVVKGVEPPASRYPRLDAGELVAPTAAAMGFPAIPGSPAPDGIINPFLDYDFGPDFNARDLSGVIAVEPPAIRGTLPSRVPRVDSDGNEIGGVPSVQHQAPLGTYLGWNVADRGFYKGRGCGFSGGFVPFARTRAERIASGDPRPSLEERYGSHEGYVAAVRKAARRLVEERYLLAEDADRIVRDAESSAILSLPR